MAPPTRIDFVITELAVGGAESFLTDLVLGLDPHRYAPRVVSLAPPPQPDRAALFARLAQAGTPIECLNVRHPWQAPVAVRRLRRLMMRDRPAIVQTVLFHANIVGVLAARSCGIPHVVSAIRVAERRRNLHGWLTRITSPWVDQYVCVSEAVARFCVEQTRLQAGRVTVIPTGIDIERFPVASADVERPASHCDELSTNFQGIPPVQPAQPTARVDPSAPSERRTILFAGRLDPQKRVDWILERAADFLGKLPQHDLVVAGEGPAKPHLQRTVQQLEIENRVRFVGWQTDMANLLAECDLVVLASAWEGMPRIVMEAMAMARPVVTTRVEGVDELMGADARGQIVDNDDRDGFVAAVVRIAADAGLMQRIGLGNRRRIAENFSLGRSVARYETLYDALLSAPAVDAVTKRGRNS